MSGGDDHSAVQESIGSRIKDFAEASKQTIKKTLHKGKETLKGAAESVQKNTRGRRRNDTDLEDGELTLLNDHDDDIGRLDKDDEKPFQSFAVQMKSFSAGGPSDYA